MSKYCFFLGEVAQVSICYKGLDSILLQFSVKKYFLIWLRWVLAAAHGIFAVSHGISRFSSGTLWMQLVGLLVPWHVGSQFPDQGSNHRLLPLCPQGSLVPPGCLVLRLWVVATSSPVFDEISCISKSLFHKVMPEAEMCSQLSCPPPPQQDWVTVVVQAVPLLFLILTGAAWELCCLIRILLLLLFSRSVMSDSVIS